MCKAYYAFYACGCQTKDPLLLISRCESYLHQTPIQTCREMLVKSPERIAVVLSDTCSSTHDPNAACASLTNLSEADRRTLVPTENVFGRYITLPEFQSLEKINLWLKPQMKQVMGAVLGLDALQSLAGTLVDALPKVDPVPDHEGNVEGGFEVESLKVALPRTLVFPSGKLPGLDYAKGMTGDGAKLPGLGCAKLGGDGDAKVTGHSGTLPGLFCAKGTDEDNGDEVL